MDIHEKLWSFHICFDYVEKFPFTLVCSVFFYHESILNFVKALSESNNLVGFVFYSVIVVDHID